MFVIAQLVRSCFLRHFSLFPGGKFGTSCNYAQVSDMSVSRKLIWRIWKLAASRTPLGFSLGNTKPKKKNKKHQAFFFQILPQTPPRLPHLNLRQGGVACVRQVMWWTLCSSPENQSKLPKTLIFWWAAEELHGAAFFWLLQVQICILWLIYSFGMSPLCTTAFYCQHIKILIIAFGRGFVPN